MKIALIALNVLASLGLALIAYDFAKMMQAGDFSTSFVWGLVSAIFGAVLCGINATEMIQSKQP